MTSQMTIGTKVQGSPRDFGGWDTDVRDLRVQSGRINRVSWFYYEEEIESQHDFYLCQTLSDAEVAEMKPSWDQGKHYNDGFLNPAEERFRKRNPNKSHINHASA